MADWLATLMLPNRALPNRVFNALNDSNDGAYASSTIYLLLAQKYNNGLFHWIYDESIGSPSNLSRNKEFPEVFVPFLISYNENSSPTAPDPSLLGSYVDFERGLVNWRTGWSNDDLYFSIESSPMFHIDPTNGDKIHFGFHTQADKGNITLTAYGYNFIYDDGHNSFHRTSPTSHQNSDLTSMSNYVTIDDNSHVGYDTGQSYGGGGELTRGEIVSLEENTFFNYVLTDNEAAFDTLYAQGGPGSSDQLIKYYEGSPSSPPGNGYINPVEKAVRSVLYIKESNRSSAYFWMIDEINKDNLTHQYDWHVLTKRFSNALEFDVSNNPININPNGPTLDYPKLDMFFVYPEPSNYSTLVQPTVGQGSRKLKVYTDTDYGYFNVLLVPVEDSEAKPAYVSISLTSGEGIKLGWKTDYNDYCFYDVNNNIQSAATFSDAKQIFARENSNTGKFVQYRIDSVTTATVNSIEFVDFSGITGKVVNDSLTVEITGTGINDFKVYAPYATSILLNGQSTAFYRVNDYVYNPTISANVTWNGDVYVSGDVTINGGFTVTAAAGTVIEFAPSAKLISNGDLSWIGTQQDSIFVQSSTTSDGYGVQVKKLGDPQNSPIGTFEYCSFKDLTTGVEVVNADLSLEKSLIKDTQKGVSLINAGTASIDDTKIRYSGIGINVDGCSPTVTDNEITGCGLGVSVVGGAGSYFENTISYSGQNPLDNLPGAFYASSGATPILQRSTNSLNQFTNNTGFGLKAYNRSTIFAGDDNLDGGNNIYTNGFDAEATFNSTIWGINNYWGTDEPAPTQFNADAGSVISYTPFLSGPATNITSARTSPKVEGLENNSLVEEGDKVVERRRLSLTEWQKQLFLLFRFEEYSTVLSMGDSLLSGGLSEEHAIFTLSLMQQSSMASYDSSFIGYIVTYSTTASSVQKQLLSGFLLEQHLKHQQYALFNSKAQEIQTAYNGTQAEAFAHFKLFHYGLYHLGSEVAAEQALGSLQSEFPNNELTYLALQQWQSVVGGEAQKRTRPIKTTRKGEKIDLIENYTLSQNYPNPFNPTTTIEYALPERSEVTITIYDVIGQEVQKLVANRISPAGVFQVNWNGKNRAGNRVASGVYIYQLTAVSLETGSQHRLNKKMTLMH